jgi:hypothetical protein
MNRVPGLPEKPSDYEKGADTRKKERKKERLFIFSTQHTAKNITS